MALTVLQDSLESSLSPGDSPESALLLPSILSLTVVTNFLTGYRPVRSLFTNVQLQRDYATAKVFVTSFFFSILRVSFDAFIFIAVDFALLSANRKCISYLSSGKNCLNTFYVHFKFTFTKKNVKS